MISCSNYPSTKEQSLFVTSAFCFTLVMTGAFAPFGVMDFDHEAVLFKPAIDLLDGKMLFRDSFTQYGPVPVLLQAAAMKIFGKYILVAKMEAAVCYATAAAFLFTSWRSILPAWQAFLSVVLWNLLSYHFFHPFLAWASVYALMFQCAGLNSLLNFMRTGRRIQLAFVGACTILTALSKLNVGIYFGGAAVAAVTWHAYVTRKSVRHFVLDFTAAVAGCISVIAPYLTWLVMFGALRAWWLANIEWPRRWAATYGGHFDLITIIDRLTAFRLLGTADPFNPAAFRPDLIFLLLPLFTLIAAAYAAWRHRKANSTTVMPLALVSLASWLQMYPVPGIGHVWWSTAPMIGLLIWGIGRVTKGHPALTAVCVFVLFAPPTWSRFHYLVADRMNASRDIIMRGENPMRGLFLSPDLASYVTSVQNAIETTIGKSQNVVMDGSDGLYLTFVNDPVRVHPLWSVDGPAIVALAYPDWPKVYEGYLHDHHPFVLSSVALAPGFMSRHPNYSLKASLSGPSILGTVPSFVILH